MATTEPTTQPIPVAVPAEEPAVDTAAEPEPDPIGEPEAEAEPEAVARRRVFLGEAARRSKAAPGSEAPARAVDSNVAVGPDVARSPSISDGLETAAGEGAILPAPAKRAHPRAGAEGPRRGQAPAAGYAHIVRARFVAVGALLAVIAAVAVIVTTTTGGSPRRAPVATPVPKHRGPRYWIVRPGQTLLSIASRESVALTDLMRLNPGLIPGGLRPGQRVRLPD